MATSGIIGAILYELAQAKFHMYVNKYIFAWRYDWQCVGQDTPTMGWSDCYKFLFIFRIFFI